MKRTIITLLAVAIAIGISVAFMSSDNKPNPESITPTQTPAPESKGLPASGGSAGEQSAAPAETAQPAETTPAAESTASATPTPTPVPAPAESATSGVDAPALPDLTVLEATDTQPEPQLGSDARTDDNKDMMQVVCTPWGAGVKQITLARYSKTAAEQQPYLVQEPVGKGPYYPLAAQAVIVNGQHLVLSDKRWQVSDQDASQATFTITVAESDGQKPVLQITRTYRLAPGSYDVQLDQQLKNLTDQPLNVQFVQLGQADMHYEPSYMGDKRSVILGYFQPKYDPSLSSVFIEGFDLSRKNVMDKPEHQKLWPTEAVATRSLRLSFVAETNRYFATAVHAPVKQVTAADQSQKTRGQPFDALFPIITRLPLNATDTQNMAIQLTSPSLAIAPGAAADLNINLFAGPKSPALLRDTAQYSAVGLDHLLIYNLGGCCSFLTFGWLAKILLAFLTFLHSLVFDWGVAIIILVLIIRTILHPITKRSQLNMMKFSRQMQTMAPELEKIKKKYADDKNKLNAETMKLYREKGVNPAAMAGGCLPMLLQMPIWYALYAMLFYAIELRHQPAFYNLFHNIAAMMGVNWSFLTDLSNADHFIMLGSWSFHIPLLHWYVDAVNILPIMMGVVFYFQQKYTTMAPTNTAEMSDQQKTQMKMMKFMIFLFPIFLYKAPAGLNLYILASTAAGIVDSKIVRNHLKELEAKGELDKPSPKKKAKPGGFMDRLQKAAEAKRKELEQSQRKGNKKGRTR